MSDSLGAATGKRSTRFERGTDGPKVIVVEVDGSGSSLRAAAYASGTARRQHALPAVVYAQPAAGAALGAPVAEATGGIAEDLVRQVGEASERARGVRLPLGVPHVPRRAVQRHGEGRGRSGPRRP